MQVEDGACNLAECAQPVGPGQGSWRRVEAETLQALPARGVRRPKPVLQVAAEHQRVDQAWGGHGLHSGRRALDFKIILEEIAEQRQQMGMPDLREEANPAQTDPTRTGDVSLSMRQSRSVRGQEMDIVLRRVAGDVLLP